MTTSTQPAENSVGSTALPWQPNKITQAITEINDMALQIASAAEEQRGDEDISRNTQGIKDASDDLARNRRKAVAIAQMKWAALLSRCAKTERFKVCKSLASL